MDAVQADRISRSGRLKYIATALLALALLLGLVAFWWWNRPVEQKAPAATLPGTVVHISATELAAAYDEDPVTAGTRFGDNSLKVTGTLTSITAGLGGDPVVVLGGSNPLLSVTAVFDTADAARLAAVPVGSRVTVTCGSVSLVGETAALEDCTLG